MYTVRYKIAIKAGDIVGFSGAARTSDIVNIATYGIPRWSLSHVGIIANYQGQKLLFESTTLDKLPCEITKKQLNGVQAHKFDDVVENYAGRVWVYPLYRPLFESEDRRLSDFVLSLVGRPYDTEGAIRSGGLLFSLVESLFRSEDLHTLFCSELCAKALSEIGLVPTDDAARWSPNHLIRHLRWHEILLKPRRVK